MDVVQVTNRNKFPLPGRYAGEDYTFPPGKPVAVSRAAAEHIFGIGQQDKTRALNNLGILIGKVTYKEALETLKRVEFTDGHVVFSESPHEPGPGKHHEPGKKAPGKDEQEDEDETESGDSPGAPKGPGGKSGAEQSAPADLDGKRKW